MISSFFLLIQSLLSYKMLNQGTQISCLIIDWDTLFHKYVKVLNIHPGIVSDRKKAYVIIQAFISIKA